MSIKSSLATDSPKVTAQFLVRNALLLAVLEDITPGDSATVNLLCPESWTRSGTNKETKFPKGGKVANFHEQMRQKVGVLTER